MVSRLTTLFTGAVKVRGDVRQALDSIKSVRGALGALSVVAAATGVAFGAALNTARFGDDTDTIAQQLGLTTRRVQELRFGARQLGLDIQDFRTAYDTLTRIEPGANLIEVLNRLQNIGDETERAELGTRLLGSGYNRLRPVLNQSAEDFNRLLGQARGLNQVVGDETVRSGNMFAQMMKIVRGALNTITVELGGALIPAFKALAPLFFNVVIPAVQLLTAVLRPLAQLIGVLSTPLVALTGGNRFGGNLTLQNNVTVNGGGGTDSLLNNNQRTARAVQDAITAGNANFLRQARQGA